MKKACVLLLLSAVFCTIGCGDKENLDLSRSFLKNTVWDGTKTYTESDVFVTDMIAVEFESSERGRLEIRAYDKEQGRYVLRHRCNFNYSIDERMLIINEIGGGRQSWELTYKNKIKMVFIEGKDSERPVKYTLRKA